MHSDTFPQRSFVANATSLTLLQCAGDLRRYQKEEKNNAKEMCALR